MTVLTYIYPRDVAALAIERLLPAARKTVPDVAIIDLQLRRRQQPDWEFVTFCHPSVLDVEMLFVASRNSKSEIAELSQRYGKAKELLAVRCAPVMIWAQHKAPVHLPQKRIEQSWDTFTELLAVIADVSNAVIWSPDNNHLYTVTAFRRHHRKHRITRLRDHSG